MQKVIIDCEFTGLDNTYMSDNEVVQLKVMNLKTKQSESRSYSSEKLIGAHAQLMLGTKRYDGDLFTKECFFDAPRQNGRPCTTDSVFSKMC